MDEILQALRRVQTEHARALSTSVGHPEVLVRKKDFRHKLCDFIVELPIDTNLKDALLHAAMNPRIPDGDALWEDV